MTFILHSFLQLNPFLLLPPSLTFNRLISVYSNMASDSPIITAYIPFVYNNVSAQHIILSISDYIPSASISAVDLLQRVRTRDSQPDLLYYIAFVKFSAFPSTVLSILNQGRTIEVPVHTSVPTKQSTFFLSKYTPKPSTEPTTEPVITSITPTYAQVLASSTPVTVSVTPVTSTDTVTTPVTSTTTTTPTTVPVFPYIPIEQRIALLEQQNLQLVHFVQLLIAKTDELEFQLFVANQSILDESFDELEIDTKTKTH